MAFENLVPGIQNLPGLVNQSKAIALQDAGRRQNLQRMDQQQFAQALMGALGFMQQGQQMEAQQGQQTIENTRADRGQDLQERQVTMQENESYAKLAQMGKDLELSDMQLKKAAELQGLDGERLLAEIANIKTDTAGEQVRQDQSNIMFPGEQVRQDQAIDLGVTQQGAADQSLQTQREVAPFAAPQAAAGVTDTEASAELKQAQSKMLDIEARVAQNPVAPSGEWMKGIQEEMTTVEGQYNARLLTIGDDLLAKDKVKAMMMTPEGEATYERLIDEQNRLRGDLRELSNLRVDMANKATELGSEDAAWAYWGQEMGRIGGSTLVPQGRSSEDIFYGVPKK